MRCLIKRLCNRYHIINRLCCAAGCDCCRCDRNSFVYDRNTEFLFNDLTGLYQVLCCFCDFIVDVLIESLNVGSSAVEQGDSQCDRTHIEILFFNHGICLMNFV